MSLYTGYSGGENTTLGIKKVWSPGDSGDPNAFGAPTTFLMAEDDGLQATVNHVERMVLGAGVDSDLGHRTGKTKNGGVIKIGLYPRNGIDLLVGATGNMASFIAVAPVTSTGMATTNNRTTFTVASSTGFVVGRPALIDTDVSGIQEPSMLLEKTATTLVFGRTKNVHGATTQVSQPAVDLISPYTKASGYANLLNKYALEEVPGDKYVNRYSGGMINKWDLNAQAARFEVSADMVFCSPRGTALPVTPTELDETAPEWGELGFEFTDGFLAFPMDVDATGTAILQLVEDGQDWSLSIDNHMREIACFDNTDAYKYFRGNRTVEMKYKILNQSNRPVAYTDFVKKNINVPWMSQCALNTGTDTAPKWQGMFFHAPNVRFLDSQELKNGNEEVGEQVTVRALKAAGSEKLYVWRLLTP